MTDQEDDADEKGSGGIQLELIKSYLSFVRRALRLRRWIALAVVFVGLGLTVAVYKYMPRMFNCTTILMAEQNQVLDSYGAPHPLAGAASLILRHDNLEALVRETNLVEKFEARRPPLLKLKDKLIEALFGEFDMDTKVSMQVGSLETRLGVGINGAGNLNISVDWTDPLTAAEVAEAARESFLRSRHSAETSAFQEKLTILEGHASKLRQEVESIAEQIDTLSKRKAEESRPRPVAAAAPVPNAPAAAPRATPRRTAVVDEQLPALREKLSQQKQKLAAIEADRDGRLRQERSKLQELKLRLTPSHPEVVTQEQRINVLSQVPSEVALLRSEIASLEGEIRQRDAMAAISKPGGSAGAAPGAAAGAAGPLPTEILHTIQREDADPVLAQQLSGAAVKYGVVRDDIRTTRIALDTAQAAFNHRYKVVVPADPPRKPYKPKPLLIIGGGLFLTLLLALGLPILAELRTGIIVERWQVQMVELPVLAELRLPPHSGD